MKTENTKFAYTPPQIAELLGIAHGKVLRWIRSGELKTRNLRTSKTGLRPRYSILHTDLMAFLDVRIVKDHPKTNRGRSVPKSEGEGDYY